MSVVHWLPSSFDGPPLPAADERNYAADVWALGPDTWVRFCERHRWVSSKAHSDTWARKNTCPGCDGDRELLAGQSRYAALLAGRE